MTACPALALITIQEVLPLNGIKDSSYPNCLTELSSVPPKKLKIPGYHLN
jgi:hypothetical protein